MIRTATISTLVLAFIAAAFVAHASTEKVYRVYEVQLDIVRDGMRIPPQATTMAAGEPARFEVACPRCGTLRVHQRVEKFPGTKGERVLVELEVFQLKGNKAMRLVAPTLGVWLGEAQSSSFKTDIGLLEIRTRVDGVQNVSMPSQRRDTMPADYGLNRWLRQLVRPYRSPDEAAFDQVCSACVALSQPCASARSRASMARSIDCTIKSASERGGLDSVR